MKKTTLIAVFAAALLSNVSGANLYYWDINGAAAGASSNATPSGTWASTSAFWNSSSDGLTTSPGTFPSGNTAVFSAGTNATGIFTVTLGSAQTVDSLIVEEGTPTLSGTGVLTLSGAATVTVANGSKLSVSSVVAGTSGITKSGAGTLSLTGANTFSGPVNLNSGILALVNSSALGASTGSGVNFNGGTLRFEFTGAGPIIASGRSVTLNSGGGTMDIFSSTGKASYDGSVTGSGNLTISGLGTLSLSAANTYSGNTTVSGTAKLKVINTTGSATGTGTVQIGSTATLTGNGKITGPVNLFGVISPGLSPGTITTGDEIWNSGGTYSWEINNPSTTEGSDPGWDVINVTGGLSINVTGTNKFTIKMSSLTSSNTPGALQNFDTNSDYSWRIVSTTTGITGFDANYFTINRTSFSNTLLPNGKFVVELGNANKDIFLKYVRTPKITGTPSSQSKDQGSTLTFSGSASGTATLSYQWRKGSVNLVDGGYVSGSQSSLLTINNLSAADAGSYTFVVSNAYGSVTSSPPAVLTVIAPPIIVTNPTNQTKIQGQTVVFSVAASGLNLSYQWQKNNEPIYNGGNISGVTTPTLTLTNVTSDDAGSYSILVSNSAGSVSSGYATLDVIVPPTIPTQLIDQTIPLGDGTSFSISVEGSETLYYQWKKNGVALTDTASVSGVNSPTLMFSGVSMADGGSYLLSVSNAAGSTVSSNVTLAVFTPTCTSSPLGLVAWWTGENNMSDVVNGITGGAGSSVSYGPGKVSQAFDFDGSANYIELPDASAFHVANVTVEAWVKATRPGNLAYIMSKSLSGGTASYAFYTGFGGGLQFYVSTTNGFFASPDAGNWVWDGKFHHIAGTYDGSNVRLYVDGSEIGRGTSGTGPITYNNSFQNGDLFIGSFSSGAGFNFAGLVDELAIYDNAFAPAQIQAVYQARGAGKCTIPALGVVSGNIYYSRKGTSSDGTIWRAHGDGSADTQITVGEWPKLSPNGQYLAFHRDNPATISLGNLYVRDLKSGVETLIFTNDSSIINYAWTSDSSKIVYDYGCNIYKMNRDGSSNQFLSTGDCYNAPDINPIDGRIVFARSSGLVVYNGTNAVANTATLPGDGWPSWSPDGQKIVFNNGVNLFKINAGGTRTQLTFLSGIGFSSFAAWTPNGSNVVAAGTVNGMNGLYVIPVDGSGVITRLITSSGSAFDFVGSVSAQTGCIAIPSGAIGLWRGDGDTKDSILYNDGTLQNGASFASGKVGQAFSLDGIDDSVRISTMTAPTGPMTLETWVKFTGSSFSGGTYNTILEFGNDAPWFGVNSSGALVLFNTISGGTVPVNSWVHVAYTWDGNLSALYINGNRVVTNNYAPPVGGIGLGIGQNSGDTAWNGLIDEVGVYNRALGPQEIQNIYDADIEGKCSLPAGYPIIIGQPQNVSLPLGSTANFNVNVSGNEGTTFRWRKNGVNLTDVDGATFISGSSSAFLMISPLQASDSGFYSVVVSNSAGVTTSIEAYLDVLTPPSIDSQPQSTTNPPGSTVVFNVAAHGSKPLYYSWKKNGYPVGLLDVANIHGANSSALTISGISSVDAGNYTVDVNNSQGYVQSSNATLTVYSVGGENYDNLISYWHADGDANDSFGSNHGTLLGSTSFSAAGKINQGFLFDGTASSGGVSIPDSASLRPSNVTIEAWVKFNSLNSAVSGGASAGEQMIVFKKNSLNANYTGFALTKGRNVLGDFFSFVIGSSSGSQIAASSPSMITTGVFYHVVGTYDGQTLSIYVNGSLAGSTVANFALDYGSRPLFFGTSGESYDGKLNGVLDEIRLYGRSLTRSEVSAHYSQGNLGFVGLRLASTNFVDGTSSDRALGLNIAGGFAYLSGTVAVGTNAGDAMISRFSLPTQSTNGPAWVTNWPGLAGADRFSSVAVSFDGVYFGGDSFNRSSDSFGTKENKGMVVKFTFNGPNPTNSGFGGAVWDKQVPASPGAFSYSGKETINGVASATEFINDSIKSVIYATGSSQRSSVNQGRLFLTKMRGDGTILWTTTDVQSTSASSDNFSAGQGVALLNGGVFVAGRNDDGGYPKATLSKYTPAGATMWTVGSTAGYFSAITAFGGSIYAVGATSTNEASADFLVEKRDETGGLIWSRTFDRVGDQDVLNGVVGIGSRVYAVGATKGNNAGGKDVAILEIDTATGDIISTTLYGGSDDDSANAAATDGADLYIAGESKSYGGSGNNVMLLRYQVSQPAVGLAIVTTSLPVGVVSNSYSLQLQAAGGLPPYTWTLATNSGSLPSGIALSSDGTISGLPTLATNAGITVLLSDSGAAESVTRSFNLFVLTAKTPPTISITVSTNGGNYEAPANLSFQVSASDSDGLSALYLYQDGNRINSSRDLSASANVTFEVNNLAAGSYNFYAVAYDYYQTPVTSGVVHVTVNAAGLNQIDFEAFDIAQGGTAVTEPTISSYLNSFGISVANVTAGSYLIVNRDQNFGGGSLISASSGHNVFTQTGKNGAVSYNLNFASPAASFRFTRVKLLGSAVGVTHPGWRATAYNGTIILGSVGENAITTYSSVNEQQYSLYGPNITSVKIEADNYNYANFTSALLDDFVVVTNAAAINNQPPTVSLSSPASNAIYSSTAEIQVAANASDADGSVASIKLYLDRTLLTTFSGASGTFTLSSLAPSTTGYQLRAEATDNQGAVRSSDPVTIFVQAAAGVNIINFDAPDASAKNIGTTNLAAYLNGYGVTVSNITTGSRLEIANVKNINGGTVVASSSPENVLAQSTRGGAVSYTLSFATPVRNVRFSRPKLLAGSYGVTFPQWRAHAFNSSGFEVASVGEPLFYAATDVLAKVFDLNASGISSVRFDSDGQQRATVSGLVIDDLILNTNSVTSALTASITSPLNNAFYASAPATVTVEANASGNNAISRVDFYAGPLLIGSDATAPFATTWTNVYPGTYQLRAVAVDTQSIQVFSDPVQITVNGGSTVNNSTFINFDSLAASAAPVSGSALESYLGVYGVSLEVQDGTTAVVRNQQSFMNAAYGSGVVANSPENVFTQTGTGDRMDFSLHFAQPLTQLQFTRVKVLAGVNGVSHPAWQAYAYDSADNIVSTVSESFISSSVDVPSQAFTLAGQGIRSVRFESINRNAASFNAVVIDDLILTHSAGNIAPAVTLISPGNGEALYAPANVTLKAVASDPDGTVVQVAFYANGNLIGNVTEPPYEIIGTNIPLGRYSLTAVATDDSGATNTSTAVSLSIIPSPFTFGIWRQPQSQSGARGGSVTFAVVATGTNLISYQWQFNAANIAGQTNAFLTLTNIDTEHEGQYRVIVTSAAVSLTSDNATLSIGDSPLIVTQPSSQTVNGGETVTFNVTASGASPLFYQWTLNGNPIPGATESTYAITGVQPFNSGYYRVLIGNALGYAQSDKANLIVLLGNSSPDSADDFEDRITINPLLGPAFGNNEQATKETGEPDHAGKRGGKSIWYTWHASFSGMISLSTKGSSFDTLLAVYTGVSVTNLTLLTADDDGGGFFSSQVTFNAVEGTDYQLAIDGFKGASGNIILGLPPGEGYRVLDYAAGEQVPQITTQPQSQFAGIGGTNSLSVVASGPGLLTYQWYLNGNTVEGATDATFTIAPFSEDSVGRYYVVVANDAGSVQSSTVALELGSVSEGVSTTTSEDKIGNVTIVVNEEVDSGDPEAQAGGTSRGYTTTQVFSTVGATKEADEPNHCGVVGGASIWYGYLAPASGTISIDTVGSTFDTILAVYTTPSGFLDFATLQSRGCTNVSGNGGEVVRFTAVSNTVYYIAVDGVAGATGTVHLNINLGTAPAITAAPHSTAVAFAGNSATFSVSASGSTNLYYNWKFNNGSITGGTNSTLNVTNVQNGINTGLYSVVVSNLVNTVTSTPVQLEIATAPNIVTQPADTNGVFRKSVTFSVVATGTATLRYQWQFDNVNISGATSSSYTKTNLVLTSAGSVRVIITNIAGAVTSSVVTLGVVPGTPTVKLPLVTTRYTNAGAVALFSGVVTNNMGVTNVQYQVNGGPFQNANLVSTNWSASITLNNAGTNIVGFKALNSFGESPTTNRNVYVYQLFPISVVINSDGAGTIAPTTTGVTNGQRLEISKTYTITAIPAALSGQGYIFTNWTGDIPGSSNKLTFQMRSNLVLQANFIENPFVASKGTYSGLFTNDSYDYTLSGFASITLLPSQSFSGSLLVNGDRNSLSGKFSLDGHVQITVSRNNFGKVPLLVDLTAEFGTDQITGTVSDGSTTAALVVDKAVYSNLSIQTNYFGKYTFILPHDSTPNQSPGGYGFGLVSVSTNGAITTAGSYLGDNTVLTQSGVSVSKEGRWPLYVGLYSSKYVTPKYLTPLITITNTGFRGAIMGWMQFTNNSAVGGVLKWMKTDISNSLPVGYTPLYSTNYPRGFTNEMEISGMKYTPVAAGRSVLSGLVYPAPTVKLFTNAVLTLSDGNLVSPITNKLFIHTNNTVTLPSTNSSWTGIKGALFAPSFTVANGLVSGSFYHPSIKKLILFKAAVLQSENRAYGFFQGYDTNGIATNQTGSISILSSP